MTDELKRPTLLGGYTAMYAQTLDPRNSDPRFEDRQRAAQETMSRQLHEARQAMQDARTRTLEQHAVYLSTFGTGDADYASKRAYMLEHGLEYNNGTLGYAPSTVHREAAWEAKQRLGQAERPLVTSSGRVDGISLAQQLGAPGKMFSRETIVAVIGAELVRRKLGAIPVPLSAAERVELEVEVTLSRLSRIFENLE